MNFRREQRVQTDVLPVAVDVELDGVPPLADITAHAYRAGCPDPICPIPVVGLTGCELHLNVPAALAEFGAGVYLITIEDCCIEVCRMQVELSSRCRIAGATLTRPRTAPETCC